MAITLAQHCRVCHPGESFRWNALPYSQSRHAREEGAEQTAPEERLYDGIKRLFEEMSMP
jgi:hypothetical protein